MYYLWSLLLKSLYSLSYKFNNANYLLNEELLERGIVIYNKNFYQPFISSNDLSYSLDKERKIPGLDIVLDKQLNFLKNFDYEKELVLFPYESDQQLQYCYNSLFGVGDAEIFYGMIRHLKPKQIIEIGAGYSTLIGQEAIKKNQQEDENYTCDHICIEPYCNPWLEKLKVKIIREKVQDLPISLFKQLNNKDILFVDSSHIIRPQGDVLFEIFDIYGSINSGVYIHVHDIFTPRDYPYEWIIKQRKLWNEQYILEAFLSFNPKFEVVLALNWLWRNHPEVLSKSCPVLTKQKKPSNPGSFWFRRV